VAAFFLTGGSTTGLSATGAWLRAAADDEGSLRLIQSRVLETGRPILLSSAGFAAVAAPSAVLPRSLKKGRAAVRVLVGQSLPDLRHLHQSKRRAAV
jgi:hypothetical protein